MKSIHCLVIVVALVGWAPVPCLYASDESHTSTGFCISDLPADDMSTFELPDSDPEVHFGSADGCPGVCRDPGHPAKPRRKKPGDIDRSDCPPCRYRICDRRRSGQPDRVAPWASRSITPKYATGYVGGGAAWGGRRRCADEGTWGLDYHGKWHPAAVFMGWTCGRKQGGEGAYQTDGEPELISAVQQKLHGSAR